jgi:streptogramin lyase
MRWRWLGLFLFLSRLTAPGAPTLPVYRFSAGLVPLAMTQDRDGLIWIATITGVVRFDGLHFDPLSSPAGMDIGGITHVAATADGSVWLGGDKGLFQYRDQVFHLRLGGSIQSLLATRSGRLLATLKSDISLYLYSDPARDPEHPVRIAGVSVTGEIQEDAQGIVWFGCALDTCGWSDADLQAAISGGSKILPRRRFGSIGAGAPHNWAAVAMLPGGRIWGRSAGDILSIEGNRVRGRWPLPAERYAGSRSRLYFDRHGRLWIPGRTLRVVENGSIRDMPREMPLGTPINEGGQDEVSAVFEDRQGTLWFGIAGRGLAALPAAAVLRVYAEAEGIPGAVLDLARDDRGNFLAATDTGAYAFHPAHDRWSPLGPSGRSAALRSLDAGPGGAVFLLPQRGGLLLSSAPSAPPRDVPLPDGIDSRAPRFLLADGQGGVWIAGHAGLLYRPPDGRWIVAPLPGRGTHASDLAPDPAGGIWVAYEGGVAHCTAGSCAQWIGPSDGLFSPKIRSIAPSDREIWVAYRSAGAYSRFIRRGDRWIVTHFRSGQGFGPPDTHFLRRDRRGWIWRGAENGVFVSDGKHCEPEDWLHLTFGDRVNASYTHMYGFLEDADGSVWIGTQAGVVHLHPSAAWFECTPRITPAGRALAAPIHLSYAGLPPFGARLFRYRIPPDTNWRLSTDGAIPYPQPEPRLWRLELAAPGSNSVLERSFGSPAPPVRQRSLWIALLAAVGTLALWGLRRGWQTYRGAREAEQYWREKRSFLESRDREGASAEDWSGRLLADRYLLEQRIAAGGFASVYRASDQQSGEAPVAVKLLHPLRDHELWRRRRFAAEVAALQELNHPGVVRIRAAGETEGRPYLVMDFVEGVTLRSLIDAGPLEFDRAALLLRQMGEALAVAHAAGILHRDLKPENVMVRNAGGARECAQLIDFGIARMQDEPAHTHSTNLAGSPGYLAPERWIGQEGRASDVYSLAAVAWEMLTGSTYVHGRDEDSPLPPAVAGILQSAMAYDPKDRPEDAAEFVRQLSNRLREERTVG